MPKEPDRPKVVKWGSGLGILLPREELSELGLVRGTVLELKVMDGALLIRATPTFEEKLATMTFQPKVQDNHGEDRDV